MKLFSYVVEHDRGHAPNPFFGFCTLCRCKYRESREKPRNVVELAEPGDWLAGTGGANQRKSPGHGKLVYAMQVDEKLTREQYYADRRFALKQPAGSGAYERTLGDSIRPQNSFERQRQFVLISRHFYYFGTNAIVIPKNQFPHLEKRGPGFRRDFAPAYIRSFVNWVIEIGHRTWRHGDPWMKDGSFSHEKGGVICKSSC